MRWARFRRDCFPHHCRVPTRRLRSCGARGQRRSPHCSSLCNKFCFLWQLQDATFPGQDGPSTAFLWLGEQARSPHTCASVRHFFLYYDDSSYIVYEDFAGSSLSHIPDHYMGGRCRIYLVAQLDRHICNPGVGLHRSHLVQIPRRISDTRTLFGRFALCPAFVPAPSYWSCCPCNTHVHRRRLFCSEARALQCEGEFFMHINRSI